MKNTRVYREQVLPHLSGLQRWIAPARYFSEHRAEMAFLLRMKGDPSCLRVLTISILEWPFGYFLRYKVWLHILLTRLNLIAKPVRE